MQAKERLQVVLEVIAGRLRVGEACARLAVSEPRFHQLREQALTAALAGLEPRPTGRPSQTPAPEQQRVLALEQQLAHKEVELKAAQVREELALTLPRVVQPPPEPEKKTTRRRPRTAHRRSGTKRPTSSG